MIGDEYFELRARLGTALYALSSLAERVRLHPARLSLLQNLIAGLKEPFLFVVAGEVNSGKSTFLNGLFGEDFCETSAIPMTAKIHYFRFGEEVRDIDVSDTLVELYRPNPFLKDFHLVDTPGTNSIEEHHQEITERYIPMADLVIFVFSVTNPWGASNWELLERIHRKWFKNVIFVLQQCDLRTPDEVDSIVEHMRMTAQQRLGTTFRVFCVSAKKALMAKTSGIDKERLWKESAFEELEKFTSDAVSHGQSRLQRVLNTTQTAQVILGEIKGRLSDAVGTLKADNQLLDRLERAVQKQKLMTRGKFVGLLETFDNDYMTLGIEAADFLDARLSIGKSLKAVAMREEAPYRVEKTMMDGLGLSVRERSRGVVETIKRDFKQLRDRLVDYIDEYYDYEERVTDDAAFPELVATTDSIAARMEKRVLDNITELGLEKRLDRMFVVRRRTIGLLLLVAAAGVVGSIALGLAGMNPLNLLGAAISVIALVGAGVYANRNAGEIVQMLGTHLEDNRDQLVGDLREAFEKGLDRVFGDFLNLFDPLRRICDEHRAENEPQIQELEELGASFHEIQTLVAEAAKGNVAELSE